MNGTTKRVRCAGSITLVAADNNTVSGWNVRTTAVCPLCNQRKPLIIGQKGRYFGNHTKPVQPETTPEPTKPVGPGPNVDLLRIELEQTRRELGMRTSQLDAVSYYLNELTLAADSMLVAFQCLNLELSTDMRRAASKAATHLAVQIDAARTKGGAR